MSDIKFLNNYFSNLKNLLSNDKYLEDLVRVKEILKKTHSEGKKTMIFGNGGSAAIASHFSVDLTKNARVRCTNYNESDLLTCFSNDYGYERWVEKAIDFYGDEGDSLILISAGGNSQNMLRTLRRVFSHQVKFLPDKQSQHESGANLPIMILWGPLCGALCGFPICLGSHPPPCCAVGLLLVQSNRPNM